MRCSACCHPWGARPLVQGVVQQRTRGLAEPPETRGLITFAGETQIVPSPDTLYGLDPFLREPLSVDALRPGALRLFNKLRPVQRRSKDHPTDADGASATEELVTPD